MTSKWKTCAAKMRFTQSKVRMLRALCSASNLRAREKRRKTSVQADSQLKGHVSPLSRAYDVLFGLSTLISNRILFHNLCEIEYPASGTLEHDQRFPLNFSQITQEDINLLLTKTTAARSSRFRDPAKNFRDPTFFEVPFATTTSVQQI